MPQRPPKENEIPINDLMEAMADKEVRGYVNEFNKRYLHWDEMRRRDVGDNDPRKIWMLMTLFRQANRKYRKFGKIRISYSFISDFLERLHKIDTMSSVGFFADDGLTKKNRIIYAVSSTMEESIASSQIEGASTTIAQAKKILREGQRPKNKSEKMVVNNYNAMKFIKTKKDEPLTPELILETHRIITKNTLDDETFEGAFRKSDDIVVQDALTGDVYHTPVDSEDIDRCIDAVCKFINDDSEFEHPVIKGIILHYVLAYIHPFMDGNGRLARALFYWYTLKKGYWAMEFLSISKAIKSHRGKYDNSFLLSESDDNDITYFIKFNLQQIETAFATFTKYIERKLIEQNSLEETIMGEGNFNLRQKTILKDAMKSGEQFTVYSVQEKFQTSYQTARNDIQKLIDSGFVEPTGKRGNMLLYSYSETKE